MPDTVAKALFLIIWATSLATVSYAQPEPDARIADVQITGELEPFDKEELEGQIQTRPNRRFLGIPGVTPSLWVYQLGGEGEGSLAGALRRAGEEPAYFDQQTLREDVERLEALYRQEGFHGASAIATVDTIQAQSGDQEVAVAVAFEIRRGNPTYIRNIRYLGVEELSTDEQRELAEETTLSISPVTPYTLRFQGDDQRLAERELLQERTSIIGYLQSIGYAAVSRDSIQAIVYGMPESSESDIPPDSVDVVMQIQTGRKYLFGDVDVLINGPDSTAPGRVESRRIGDGEIHFSISGDGGISPAIVERALDFMPGEEFDIDDLLTTKQRLDRTGVFTFTDITPTETTKSRTGQFRLSHRISLRTRQRHGIRLEGFVLERTGILGAENNEVAFGAGARYQNANIFGRGETFTVRASGSVAGDISGGFPNAQAEIGSTLSLTSLMPPFGFVEPLVDPLDTRTQINIGFLTARQEALGVIIRGRASLGLSLEASHTTVTSSVLDLLDISLSDPDTLSGFAGNFLSFVEDPVARQFVLDDYTQPQINTVFRYRFSSSTANPFRRNQGSVLDMSAEIGGNLATLLDRYVFTPDTTEHSLPGLPFFGGSDESRLEYRPYIRALADVRRYISDVNNTLALRLLIGAAHPTGNSPVIPFDRRFYAGGASSVRGWSFRTLGPGSLEGDRAYVQGGDIKLELNTELRHTFFADLLQADWQLALFADAGNVWFGPRNPGDDAGQFEFDRFYHEIAVGAGYGLRIGWDYLILRLDLGYKFHSPIRGEGWLPDGLGSPQLHFGIGQAF